MAEPMTAEHSSIPDIAKHPLKGFYDRTQSSMTDLGCLPLSDLLVIVLSVRLLLLREDFQICRNAHEGDVGPMNFACPSATEKIPISGFVMFVFLSHNIL
jgi:hypothetical protein